MSDIIHFHEKKRKRVISAIISCILQDLLEPDADEAVRNLLPDYAEGDLSALCVWADQIRHWYKYRWTSPLHFIDTPDKACSFVYLSNTTYLSFLITVLIDDYIVVSHSSKYSTTINYYYIYQ